MAKTKVSVSVSRGESVDMVGIHIDGQPVELLNDRGTASLEPGRHLLMWHFAGDPGDTLAIIVKTGDTVVREVKKSRIPEGENAGAGVGRFEL